MIEFVLGGARSGKSRYAEEQAAKAGKQVVYIATAEAGDAEMKSRISQHQHRRPEQWETIEEPIQLASVIKFHDNNDSCLLVDCLTLWLSNIMFDRQGREQQVVFSHETSALLEVLSTFSGHVVLVSNELGLGVIAMDKMTRKFVDEAGLLHQKIAALSDRVVLVTAGIPQVIK